MVGFKIGIADSYDLFNMFFGPMSNLLQFVPVNGYAIFFCVVPILGCSARNICVALLDYQKLFKVQTWITSKELKVVKELKEVGNTCCWKLFILLSRLRHTPRNPIIYLISWRNTEEASVSILVKDQSASLVRQLLQTKDEFPLQNHLNNIAAQVN